MRILRVRNRRVQATVALPDVRDIALGSISTQEGRMNVWCFPITQHFWTAKCDICGSEIEQRASGRLERICRRCLIRVPEKRAA